MNLITKPVEITIKPQPQLDYVSLLGLKKEVPQSTGPTYGDNISNVDDDIRTKLSIKCRNVFGAHNVLKPLTDSNIQELNTVGFTFFGSDTTNVLILDTTNSKGCETIIKDELDTVDDYDLGYTAKYIANYPNDNLSLVSLGKLVRETSLYDDVIAKIAKTAESIKCSISNENSLICDKYLCILRWE